LRQSKWQTSGGETVVSVLRVFRDVLIERRPEALKYLLPSGFYRDRMTIRGVTIPLPKSEVMREAVFTQSYSLIRDNAFKYISPDLEPDLILDLGASYGIIALSYATKHPNAKVFAFEPDPQGYEYAKSLVDINNMDNVSLFNVAVDAKAGTRDLYVNKERCEHSSFFKNDSNTGGNGDVVRVECIDIAEFIRAHDIDRIDVLKVDIEGAEFAVFEHMDRQRLWPIVRNVFAEVHLDYGDYKSTRLRSLIGVLEDNGFFLKIHSTGSDSRLSRLLLWGSKDAIVT